MNEVFLMLLKIHQHYPNSILSDTNQDRTDYHWFQEGDQWLGIPFSDLSVQELNLLNTLFAEQKHIQKHSPAAESWRQFLTEEGEFPHHTADAEYRIIHFSVTKGEWNFFDFEAAFKGFFHRNMHMFWSNDYEGAIIEEYNLQSPQAEDLEGICHAIESDFLTNLTLYVGIPQQVTKELSKSYQHDHKIFQHAQQTSHAEKVLTFEALLPALLVDTLPQYIQESILARFSILREDDDLLKTIDVFLQNGSNASLTAKKLFIHRNTLQYRLDKFSEKTGINLKDFNQAATVYITCLYLKKSNR
jgi:PucR C-terminal helix-turn-helix domain